MDSGTAMTRCPGCGLCLPNSQHETPERFNASGECWQQYSDLLCYTVAKRDTGFIHQHAVDAYASQHSGGTTRNSSIAFGLIGLYLALEKGYTGRQVQLAHMRIARIQKNWPRLEPPAKPAEITVMDVLRAGTDKKKDAVIRQWMAAVWESWADRQVWVRETAGGLIDRSP